MDIKSYIKKHPYQAYSYSYPHKHSYRPLPSPLSLRQVWREDSVSSLFLYVHIPFCEMRCGFCNLFTLANPQSALQQAYVDALIGETQATARALGEVGIARLAFGGGTPSFLGTAQLESLFATLSSKFALDVEAVPCSFEVSPYTADRDRIELLKQAGVDRVSIGIQSFIETETLRIGRHQPQAVLRAALDTLCRQQFPTLNIDLIYGIPGQTERSWRHTLTQTLEYRPQEIYLYPLYIRPLTGIGRRLSEADRQRFDHRRQLYRAGRDYLLSHGYEQLSLRMFRRRGVEEQAGPVYCCQEDGMIGLGAGARSYTSSLHYSSRYAVGRSGTRRIITDYIEAGAAQEPLVDYGYRLDAEDQRRRYLILSLLSRPGVDFSLYRQRFGSPLLDDFPQLHQLVEHEFATCSSEGMRLTDEGLEYSDSIGPWLYSARVNRLMREYRLQ